MVSLAHKMSGGGGVTMPSDGVVKPAKPLGMAVWGALLARNDGVTCPTSAMVAMGGHIGVSEAACSTANI